MAKKEGRTNFHYGFYAAMKVEYDIMHADVEYRQEVQLGNEPIRLDFLIIKKAPGVILSDPIGKFFRAVNIFEYKSPEDGLSIDDFYKVQGYGLIYKGLNRKVNELPIEDMTLTLVRDSYPRELMKTLEESGFVVKEEHPGIFSFDGKISILVQLVVSSRLPPNEYEGLRLLTKGCTKDVFLSYAEKAMATDNDNIKTNAGTVMRICLGMNKELKREIKEEEIMKDVIREIFEEDFDIAEKRGRQAGRQEGRQEGINEANERFATDMLRDGKPLNEIMRYSRLAEDTIRSLAKSLGVAVI